MQSDFNEFCVQNHLIQTLLTKKHWHINSASWFQRIIRHRQEQIVIIGCQAPPNQAPGASVESLSICVA